MKRFFSGDSDDSPLISKLAKVKNTLFSKFITTNKENNNNSNGYKNENEATINSNLNKYNRSFTPISNIGNSSFNTSQTPITARQLQAYYNSLKLQNEVLTEKLENETNKTKQEENNKISAKDSWNNAESTNIDIDSSTTNNNKNNKIINNKEIENSNDKSKEIINDNHNTIIFFNENEPAKDSKLDEFEDEFGLPLILSQPDPLERANLVQLKKMMELEKYRRYRLNYLREHTRNLNRSGINKVSKNILKKKHVKSKFSDIKKLPKERQNTSGVFGISLLDTVEDNNKETIDIDVIKPIDDDITKKIKFSENESKIPSIPTSSKQKSFNANKLKVELKEEPSIKPIENEEPIVKTPVKTPIFDSKIALSKPTSVDDQPTGAFKFNKDSNKISSATTPAPVLSDTTAKTSFTFGTDSAKKTKTVTIEKLQDEDGLTASFLDLKRKVPEKSMQASTKDIKIPSLFGSSTEKKTLFSDTKSKITEPVKNNTAGFKFGPTLSDDASKISLNFGTKNPEKKSEFQFSAVPSSTTQSLSTSTATPASLPKFNFGNNNSAEEKKPTTVKETETPKFNFGSKPNSTPSPKFSFGTNSNSEAPKLTFSTSDPKKIDDNNKDEEKPKSLFGGFGSTNQADALKFNFQGSSQGKTETLNSTPISISNNGFSFSNGPSIEEKNNTNKPSMTSTIKENEEKPNHLPAFNFGKDNDSTAKRSNNDITEQPSTKKPTFNFGNNTTISAFGSIKPANNSGLEKTSEKSTFTFGNTGSIINSNESASTEKITTPNTSAFNFNPKENKELKQTTPSFNFKPNEDTANKPLTTASFDTSKIAGLPKIGDVKNSSSISTTPSFSFGGNNSNSSNTFTTNNTNITNNKPIFGSTNSFGSNNNTNNNANGISSTGFSFGTNNGSTNGFGGQNNNNNNNESQITSGKIFSFNNNAFPSLKQTPFGNNNNTNNGQQNSTFNFGGSNNSNNNGNNSLVQSAFGGLISNEMNKSNNNNNNNNGNIFGASSNNASDALQLNNMSNGGFSSANSTRLNTPSFNFTGQSTNIDPSSIFQSGPNGTPPPQQQGGQNTMTRRRAFPRSMRGGRR